MSRFQIRSGKELGNVNGAGRSIRPLAGREICDIASDFCGRSLENWFLKHYSESGEWTAVGQWWDKKGENEIDLIAVNELEDKIQFAEIKRNPKKIRLEKLREKAEVFLKNNAKYQKFFVSFKGLSLEDLKK